MSETFFICSINIFFLNPDRGHRVMFKMFLTSVFKLSIYLIITKKVHLHTHTHTYEAYHFHIIRSTL